MWSKTKRCYAFYKDLNCSGWVLEPHSKLPIVLCRHPLCPIVSDNQSKHSMGKHGPIHSIKQWIIHIASLTLGKIHWHQEALNWSHSRNRMVIHAFNVNHYILPVKLKNELTQFIGHITQIHKIQMHEQLSYLEYSYLRTEMPVIVSNKSKPVGGGRGFPWEPLKRKWFPFIIFVSSCS